MDKQTLRIVIENLVSALAGDSFQDFCDRLCMVLYPNDYTPVRAAGPHGDTKNDGYCPKARVFCQAHATRGEEVAKTKNKIANDLSGCVSQHSNIKNWIYLTNDTLIGEVEQFIDEELRPKYSSIVIETWGHKKIVDAILGFSEEEIEKISGLNLGLALTEYDVLGQIEDNETSIVDTIFRNVLNDIETGVGDKYTYSESIKIVEKIQINFISTQERNSVSEYFRFAYRKYKLIQDRVQLEKPEVQNDLHADIFERYSKLKTQNLSNIEILDKLFTDYVPSGYEENETYKNLSKAYVLFFFEDCTIFEKTAGERN
jgi:hypothetical protein